MRQEAVCYHPFDHADLWIEISIDIQKAARFGMDTQLRPSPLFEDLLKRAYAAGERNEGI